MTRKNFHIVYIISRLEESRAFEWIALALDKQYKITFLLLNSAVSPLEAFLVQNRIGVKRLKFRSKKDYPATFLYLCYYFLSKRPDVVHAHLLDAQLLGLSAAWLARIKKRIYTRHTSNYHHVYSPGGVKYDQWSNFLATHIVSISQATDHTLLELEKVNEGKIRKIYHGFQLSVFNRRDKDKIDSIRSRWRISERYPCVGVIARHIQWKGIQFIIPAFADLLKDFPSAVLVLANAQGPYQENLMEKLSVIPRANYVLIPFEKDIASLYALFDLYVHVPVDATCEAFGQSYVEALAAEIPCVFTLSGVAAEFIQHRRNAWVVDFCDADQIYKGMKNILNDVGLQQKLKQEGRKSVEALFGFGEMMTKLDQLYNE